MSIFSSLFGGHDTRPKGSFAISDKELLVRGWSDTELRPIINDFQQAYLAGLQNLHWLWENRFEDETVRVSYRVSRAPDGRPSG